MRMGAMEVHMEESDDTAEVMRKFNEFVGNAHDLTKDWGEIDNMTIKEIRTKLTQPGDQLVDPSHKASIASVIAIVVVTT
jgi:hypothetical protein